MPSHTLKPADTSDSALLQRRVANLGLLLAGIGSAFVAMRVVAVLVVGRPEHLTSTSMVVHYVAVLVSTAMWLACRAGRRRPVTSYAVELVGLFTACSLYAVMAAGIPQAFRPEMTLVLAFGVFLLAHAVRVPSSWEWTASLGTALAAPLLIGAWLILTPMDPRIVAASASASGSVQTTPQSIVGIGMASVVTWWVVIVATAATASAVIYGLRREVRDAMQLGQYTLEGRIGQGGMGVVFKARHALLQRPTALKLLPPDIAGERAIRRFEAEVQQTSRLTHPNTVSIYDYGRTVDGVFYYVMEYLDGISLQELPQLDGPQPPGRVIYILSQAAHALAEAHAMGLVHRDIKPANILLVDHGGAADLVKLVDFGLVRDVSHDTQLSQTSANTLEGTPLYTPPEAVTSPAEVDGRSDLYSLGAVGYYLLCAAPPFDGRTTLEVLSKHLREQPLPPSARLGTSLPSDLEGLVMRCLAKEPGQRPESARALWTALRSCRDAAAWNVLEAEQWWKQKRETIDRRREESRRQGRHDGTTPARPSVAVPRRPGAQ
jgi:tRNA A-37 threonylcarbamoyl transferase component Bud32